MSMKGSKARSQLEMFLSVRGQNVGVRKDAVYTTMYISHLTKNNLLFFFYLVVPGMGLNLYIPSVVDMLSIS